MAFIFCARGAVARRQVKSYKHSEDTKLQNITPKRRKGRKSVVNKHSIVVRKSHEENSQNDAVRVSEGIRDAETTFRLLPLNPSDGNINCTEGRKIGKLIVTNKEIAKGSNGTIVLEGNYDGRSVAVKRLVRTHHNVAVKEIQNLIASDQHPNIVRWDVLCGLAHLHELGIIHRSGSSGWQAPEQLRSERQTRAVDLFSLGCILFFCMTGGKHPFGESLERDVNIVNDRKDLFLIDNIPEATNLVSRLLDPNPDLRPKAIEVMHHPLFWDSEMRLSFLRDASDRVELEDRENGSQLLEALENRGRAAWWQMG
ncbi:UNVERIFIED_CONTAM: Serine/threonine-protein kinase/endoribonuclease IRE1b [Sesamum radiatum]|uniref:non-specific serine/threonine protein kinase n=1 Tax=Sesamum radiatum TaxID=300843 RepID=A0AAW2Q273_SESRA